MSHRSDLGRYRSDFWDGSLRNVVAAECLWREDVSSYLSCHEGIELRQDQKGQPVGVHLKTLI